MKLKYSFLLLAILSLFCFISCRTIPMYTEIDTTLIVGEVLFKSNMKEFGRAFDGINVSGIEILLKNTATNKNFRISADKNGLFFANLQNGRYKIEELFIKKKYNDGSWYEFCMKQPTTRVLEIENGIVNNIGTLQWTFVDRMNNVVQVDNSSDIKIKFSERYPKSNWNQIEWKYKQWDFDFLEPQELMYNELNPTLLVGEVIFTGKNFVTDNGVSFEGTTTSGIVLLLQNIVTNETIEFPADKNGLFYTNLQEGKYIIDEMLIRKYNENENWFDLFISQPTIKVIEIEKGKVNNIGTLRWSLDRRTQNFFQEDNSSHVKIKFSERYPESNWNQIEWKYKQLSFDIKEPSEPLYNEMNPTLLVGEVIFSEDIFVSEKGVFFDGTTTSGIELVLKNTVTNETLEFPADKNGLFYINLQEGKYKIDELFIRKYSNDDNWSDFYIRQPNMKELVIEKGKVNNIGTLKLPFIIQENNATHVKIKFSERYPESNWNQIEWKYKQLSFE
ncbi:MAG: hypothetical protein FWH18_10825 [Marinilabiliaceae bacterium]|nr:hypothetical protein [Marinilabiliaceae bacterium]